MSFLVSSILRTDAEKTEWGRKLLHYRGNITLHLGVFLACLS